ncbi:MAG: hypothetical protein A2Z14_01260 [Chloroflexi bacterium RBG_16_48_8]|nr:MAG: hypothetical protein A2Z14_01260 [Chloroflexi bacterium RBG_16_48_8]
MNFPDLYQIKQVINPVALEDVEKTLEERLLKTKLLDKVISGSRVVIGAGSRGIPNYPLVLRKLVELLKERGAKVFILPVMGSHGGATGQGQVRVLEELKITLETIGAPIIDTMDVFTLDHTPSGVPVPVDRNLTECDHILLVNRVKVHTEFHGKIESGLCKMMAIGFGRYQGAIETHNYAVSLGYERTIREVARVYIEKLPILAGIALVDTPDNRTAKLEIVLPKNFEKIEEELLAYSRDISVKLPLEDIDVLLVDQLGKNISGAGFDTKVIGRIMNIYEDDLESPRITRIVLRDLTPETYGNAIGIGLADFTTQRCVDKIDVNVTNINCITAVTPEKARIPITLPNDKEALQVAFKNIGPKDEKTVRLLWIKNTSNIVNLMVSPAAKDAIPPEKIEVLRGPVKMEFDKDNNLIAPW